jgi:hypothetical protein
LATVAGEGAPFSAEGLEEPASPATVAKSSSSPPGRLTAGPIFPVQPNEATTTASESNEPGTRIMTNLRGIYFVRQPK